MAAIIYIADVSALLHLVRPPAPRSRLNHLTKLAKDGRLRFPSAVKREIAKKEDRLKGWTARHGDRCLINTDNQNTKDLARISRDHVDLLKDKIGSADPILLAMAVYYKEGGWMVLTDDGGVQAACIRESILYVTSPAFCRLEEV